MSEKSSCNTFNCWRGHASSGRWTNCHWYLGSWYPSKRSGSGTGIWPLNVIQPPSGGALSWGSSPGWIVWVRSTGPMHLAKLWREAWHSLLCTSTEKNQGASIILDCSGTGRPPTQTQTQTKRHTEAKTEAEYSFFPSSWICLLILIWNIWNNQGTNRHVSFEASLSLSLSRRVPRPRTIQDDWGTPVLSRRSTRWSGVFSWSTLPSLEEHAPPMRQPTERSYSPGQHQLFYWVINSPSAPKVQHTSLKVTL